MPYLACKSSADVQLGPCNVCGGSGVSQINEPLIVHTCGRCNGSGKDRIVQLLSDELSALGLTANGYIVEVEARS